MNTNHNHPFRIDDPRDQPIEIIKKKRIDRIQEINLCIQAVTEESQNILLYGDRGVGKTFVLRLIFDEISKSNQSILPVSIYLTGLTCYGNDDIVASFSRAILLQVCSTIWTDLLGKRYTDLREELDYTKTKIKFRKESERTIIRIYSLLMSSNYAARKKLYTSLGMNSVIKGEMHEELGIEKKQLDVLPFEFSQFVDEITKYVLKPLGKTRIIAFCDEANLIPLFQQEDILNRYFELFNTKQVQFIFIAGINSWSKIHDISNCFDSIFEIKGLTNFNDVKNLINQEESGIFFEDSGINFLFDEFDGNPRKILSTCNRLYNNQQYRNVNEIITLEKIKKLCGDLKNEELDYLRAIRNDEDYLKLYNNTNWDRYRLPKHHKK